MNDAAGTPVKPTRIVFPDSMITTWAGALPLPDVLASGTDCGFHRFCRLDGPIQDVIPVKVVPSSEAINGLAFTEVGDYDLIAASTRAELVVLRHANDGRYIGYALHEGGAHGVHATAWGGFLAPLGREGLVSIFSDPMGHFKPSSLVGKNGFPYFYKLASLGLKEDKEVWVAAGRTNGLLSVLLRKNGEIEWNGARQSTKQPVDFVGICSIGNSEYPRSGRFRTRSHTSLQHRLAGRSSPADSEVS